MSINWLQRSTTQTVDPADGVAKFLQDLCYNPVLRKKFQADATSVPVNQRTTKIDALLKPYGCTTDDLKGGYQKFLFTSTIAWQSVYIVHPTDLARDKESHTIIIIGSKSGSITVLYENTTIVGLKNGFPGAVTWASKQSGKTNAPGNGSITFKYDNSESGDDSIGNRVLHAKFWADGEDEPDGDTHVGGDFFDDIQQFDGTYNSTKIVYPENGGLPSETADLDVKVEVSVRGALPGQSRASLKVRNHDGTGDSITLISNAPAPQNTVSWSKEDDKDAKFNDDNAKWRQGYLNFTWQYVAGNPDKHTDPKLVRQLQGAIYDKELDASIVISGTQNTPDAPKDVDIIVAFMVGYLGTTIPFEFMGVVLFKTVQKLVEYIKQKRENSKKEDPSEEDLKREEAAGDGIAASTRTFSQRDIAANMPDRDSPETWERRTDNRGNPETTPEGHAVYETPIRPSPDAGIAQADGPNDDVQYKVVNNQGRDPEELRTLPTEARFEGVNHIQIEVAQFRSIFVSREVRGGEIRGILIETDGRPITGHGEE
ncbi:hypothetical protein SISNIDRAFT_547860 [Sistotremastrum niveocremeum HHB9708]|uniref:Uncharacterized protein n=1 Tax=Sistotremastrum niveocremeum HHB9708 TaxID=1314777 RepID=A0A164Y0B8_9AGAM|nr:hypothetical protein SISNIDRAFT_547860 [Sistotremastrum niveocremeum HHB9708]